MTKKSNQPSIGGEEDIIAADSLVVTQGQPECPCCRSPLVGSHYEECLLYCQKCKKHYPEFSDILSDRETAQ
jgi:hypothetical protein